MNTTVVREVFKILFFNVIGPYILYSGADFKKFLGRGAAGVTEKIVPRKKCLAGENFPENFVLGDTFFRGGTIFFCDTGTRGEAGERGESKLRLEGLAERQSPPAGYSWYRAPEASICDQKYLLEGSSQAPIDLKEKHAIRDRKTGLSLDPRPQPLSILKAPS